MVKRIALIKVPQPFTLHRSPKCSFFFQKIRDVVQGRDAKG